MLHAEFSICHDMSSFCESSFHPIHETLLSILHQSLCGTCNQCQWHLAPFLLSSSLWAAGQTQGRGSVAWGTTCVMGSGVTIWVLMCYWRWAGWWRAARISAGPRISMKGAKIQQNIKQTPFGLTGLCKADMVHGHGVAREESSSFKAIKAMKLQFNEIKIQLCYFRLKIGSVKIVSRRESWHQGPNTIRIIFTLRPVANYTDRLFAKEDKGMVNHENNEEIWGYHEWEKAYNSWE